MYPDGRSQRGRTLAGLEDVLAELSKHDEGMMASAWVSSPIHSCQLSRGSWLVISIRFTKVCSESSARAAVSAAWRRRLSGSLVSGAGRQAA